MTGTNSILRRAILLASFVALSNTAFGQTTWYVDTLNCPGPGTGTPANPFCSIQEGIAVAVNGDTVEVAPGSYAETIDLLGKVITVVSSGGAVDTIIDAAGAGTAVTCNSGETSSTVLEGFTITGGSGFIAGGMRNLNSSPTVRNCTFTGNSTTIAGGMLNTNSAPTLVNCVFWQNSGSAHSGAMFNEVSSAPIIINCVFAENSGGSLGGAIRNSTSFPVLDNCILWGNTPDEVVDTSGASTISFSDIQGGWAGAGSNNISLDPLFTDSGAGDLRLYRFSPCIDAGDNDAVPSGATTDLGGAPRFADDAGVVDSGNAGVAGPPITDMGAYERQVVSGPMQIIIDPGESIQAVIDASIDGDELVVNPGTYSEVIVFNGKAVTLRSTNPADPAVVAATIIDATGRNDNAVKCRNGEGPDTVLDGLTITGGIASPASGGGGGMYNILASPTVRNCVFRDNHAEFRGGGMYNFSSNPVVTNCTFEANGADLSLVTGMGGGMYNFNANPVVTGCTFVNNTAKWGGGGMFNDGSSPVIASCRFLGNSTTDGSVAGFGGGGMLCKNTSDPSLANCLFSGNTSSAGGGGLENRDGNLTAAHCVFIANDAAGGSGMSNSSSSSTFDNCIWWGNVGEEFSSFGGAPIINYSVIENDGLGLPGSYTGANNIILIGDAIRFVDADGPDDVFGTVDDDVRLKRFSPCVDAGSNSLVPADTADLDDDGNTTEPLPFDLNGNPRFFDDAGVADMGAGAPPLVDIGAQERQDPSLSETHNVNPGESIQAVIDDSDTLDGDVIVVFPGVYNESIQYMNKVLTVRSRDPDDPTIVATTVIDATGIGPTSTVLMVFNDSAAQGMDAVLEGLTITGGTGTNHGMWGGGVYISGAPTVRRCVITGNAAVSGGGLSAAKNPKVISCAFIGNSATGEGGGIYSFHTSTATVTNCLFSGNWAGGDGGGMYNDSASPTLTNCTFSGNVADGSGGSIFNGGSFGSNQSLVNCILWGDDPDAVVDDVGSTSSIDFCDIQDGWSGANNIDIPPKFVDPDGADNTPGTLDDDLRLLHDSPAIDAGDDGAPGLPPTDFEGNPRIVGVRVDMGIYEWPSPTAVEDPGSKAVPSASAITGVHPNPFNPRVTITFDLDRERHVQVTVYDLRGRRVRTLASERRLADRHRIVWNGKDDGGREMATGVYLLRIESEGWIDQRKVTLLK